jgi:hypothetical protein
VLGCVTHSLRPLSTIPCTHLLQHRFVGTHAYTFCQFTIFNQTASTIEQINLSQSTQYALMNESTMSSDDDRQANKNARSIELNRSTSISQVAVA